MEFLSQKGIPYMERNIVHDETARQELTDTYKALGVPVVVIGDRVIMGFDRKEIERALEAQ